RVVMLPTGSLNTWDSDRNFIPAFSPRSADQVPPDSGIPAVYLGDLRGEDNPLHGLGNSPYVSNVHITMYPYQSPTPSLPPTMKCLVEALYATEPVSPALGMDNGGSVGFLPFNHDTIATSTNLPPAAPGLSKVAVVYDPSLALANRQFCTAKMSARLAREVVRSHQAKHMLVVEPLCPRPENALIPSPTRILVTVRSNLQLQPGRLGADQGLADTVTSAISPDAVPALPQNKTLSVRSQSRAQRGETIRMFSMWVFLPLTERSRPTYQEAQDAMSTPRPAKVSLNGAVLI
ncbi:hypothetical protein PQX77_006595, partial [Marasmius sp. AFHP31]